MPGALHPIRLRLLAEELFLLRRSDQARRYASAVRSGRIDPNPHQIAAAVFALQKVGGGTGGCILADEVGLGKTIEAGLTLAQLRAEGKRRFLVLVPKSLLGQWQAELLRLFDLEAREAALAGLEGEGVFLAGREWAAGPGARLLEAVPPFDLVVVDEAHEIFSAIHRRFDADGVYDPRSEEAQMAGRLRGFLQRTPALLLTATPIQNSLAELWGLVHYLDPDGRVLGDLATFRALFCRDGEKEIVPELAGELRRRLRLVLHRTLRREAQEFLERPFVARSCRLVPYRMTPEERDLYQAVSDWLSEPDLQAFSGRGRGLLLVAFRRRMASSVAALAASLARVAARLEALTRGVEPPELPALEDEDLELEGLAEDEGEGPAPDPERAAEELARVRGLLAQARAVRRDSKVERILEELSGLGARKGGAGKAVIFTESIATQEHLRARLLEAGFAAGEVTLFRSRNDSPEARAALERWQREVGSRLPAYRRPSRPVAQRLALVHEFETRSRFLVSTEAGAKGLNLQCADTVINADLPWNPQRIEQRIGRCHRYGQTRDVTVVNFVSADNEAEQLLVDILAKKIELFGQVLDCSDEVLFTPDPGAPHPEALAGALGPGLEQGLARLYRRARSQAEVVAGLVRLGEEVGARRERLSHALARSVEVLATRFSEDVRVHFRRLAGEVREGLAALDKDLERLVVGFLEDAGLPHRVTLDPGGGRTIEAAPAPGWPAGLEGGGTFRAGGPPAPGEERLHSGHPLVRAALQSIRERTAGPLAVRVRVPPGDPLAFGAGRRGWLVVERLGFLAVEAEERLVAAAALEGESDPLPAVALRRLVESAELKDAPAGEGAEPAPPAVRQALEEGLAEARLEARLAVSREQEDLYRRSLEQLEAWVFDRAAILRRRLEEVRERWREEKEKGERALGQAEIARARSRVAELEDERTKLEQRVSRLAVRDDPVYARVRAEIERRWHAPPASSPVLEAAWRIEVGAPEGDAGGQGAW